MTENTENTENNQLKKSIPTVVVIDAPAAEAPVVETKVEIAAPKTLSEEILASAAATVTKRELEASMEAESKPPKAKSSKPKVAKPKTAKVEKTEVEPENTDSGEEVVIEPDAATKIPAETVEAAAQREDNRLRFKDLPLSKNVLAAVESLATSSRLRFRSKSFRICSMVVT